MINNRVSPERPSLKTGVSQRNQEVRCDPLFSFKRAVFQTQCTGSLVEPVFSGEGHGLTPEFFGQSRTLAALSAMPVIELVTRSGQGYRNVHGLSDAHQSFSKNGCRRPARRPLPWAADQAELAGHN